jgi:hypothetical protein
VKTKKKHLRLSTRRKRCKCITFCRKKKSNCRDKLTNKELNRLKDILSTKLYLAFYHDQNLAEHDGGAGFNHDHRPYTQIFTTTRFNGWLTINRSGSAGDVIELRALSLQIIFMIWRLYHDKLNQMSFILRTNILME